MSRATSWASVIWAVWLWTAATPAAAARFVYVASPSGNRIDAFRSNGNDGTLSPVPGSPFYPPNGVATVALHPSGRFVFATSWGIANAVSTFDKDRVTGALTHASAVYTGGQYPHAMVVDPLGQYLFVLNHSSADVSVFRVNAKTGLLKAVTGSPFATGPNPTDGAMDPSGRFLYLASSAAIHGFSLDRVTGALTPLPGSPFPSGGTYGLTVHPSGRFVYSVGIWGQDVYAFRINGITGALQQVPGSPFPTGIGPAVRVITHPRAQWLYVVHSGYRMVSGHGIDADTGALTGPLPGSPYAAGPGPAEIAMDSLGNYAYVTNNSDHTTSLFAVDPASGALLPGSPRTPMWGPWGLAVTADDFVRGDMRDDLQGDLLWRHEVSAHTMVWNMQQGQPAQVIPLNPAASPADVDFKIVGAHDFDGDWKTDILWRHASTGETMLWYMNGTTLMADAPLSSAFADPAWDVGGTGDFDLDGRADIAWRHRPTGRLVVTYMNSYTQLSEAPMSPYVVSDLDWRLAGADDFNGDRKVDLVWHHRTSGEVVLWYMDGRRLASAVPTSPPGLVDTNWTIGAVGDYNGDRRPDLVWRHGVTGDNVLWLMNGPTLIGGSSTALPTVTDAAWRIRAPR